MISNPFYKDKGDGQKINRIRIGFGKSAYFENFGTTKPIELRTETSGCTSSDPWRPATDAGEARQHTVITGHTNYVVLFVFGHRLNTEI